MLSPVFCLLYTLYIYGGTISSDPPNPQKAGVFSQPRLQAAVERSLEVTQHQSDQRYNSYRLSLSRLVTQPH